MLDVFISHSSEDTQIAEALIDLIRAATNVAHGRIRCTSVDGYRLPAGVSTDEQLKQEVRESLCFIALLSPDSLHSSYVMFELGARWGARMALKPLLAAGATTKSLRAPLSALNALSCASTSQLHQLVAEVAQAIGQEVAAPAAYDRALQRLIALNVEASNANHTEHQEPTAPTTAQEQTQDSFEPTSDAAKELLGLIQKESDAGMRGLVEIQSEIFPGQTCFFPKLEYAGEPIGWKSRAFREGVSELVKLQWLYPPEDNESTNTRTYEYKGR